MLRSVLAFATLVGVAATGVAAQDVIGEQEFMIACAGCHGTAGQGGDGPLAEFLTIEVPSLTGLSAANDGEFPYLDVFMIVDGRTGVRGHGGAMPVWGDRYNAEVQELGSHASELITRGRVGVLVDYLASIQE